MWSDELRSLRRDVQTAPVGHTGHPARVVTRSCHLVQSSAAPRASARRVPGYVHRLCAVVHRRRDVAASLGSQLAVQRARAWCERPIRELVVQGDPHVRRGAGSSDGRILDLSSCPGVTIEGLKSKTRTIQLPEGRKVSFYPFGIGVQIYRWNGTKWDFVNPSANLFTDAGGKGLVGTHFGGPSAALPSSITRR